MEIWVPAAGRLERTGQLLGEPISIGVGRLEPQECPPRRLFIDTGVDTLQLADDDRNSAHHRTESKILSNDYATKHPRILAHLSKHASRIAKLMSVAPMLRFVPWGPFIVRVPLFAPRSRPIGTRPNLPEHVSPNPAPDLPPNAVCGAH